MAQRGKRYHELRAWAGVSRYDVVTYVKARKVRINLRALYEFERGDSEKIKDDRAWPLMAEAVEKTPYLILTGIEKRDSALLAVDLPDRRVVARLASGITRASLWAAIGVCKNSFGSYERGDVNIPRNVRDLYSRHLNIPQRLLFANSSGKLRHLTAEQIEILRAGAEAHLSFRKMGNKVGLAKSTVAKFLNEIGKKNSKRVSGKGIDLMKLAKLAQKYPGLSSTALARLLAKSGGQEHYHNQIRWALLKIRARNQKGWASTSFRAFISLLSLGGIFVAVPGFLKLGLLLFVVGLSHLFLADIQAFLPSYPRRHFNLYSLRAA
jgi:hypothetical protein